jgi:hypothetical protein
MTIVLDSSLFVAGIYEVEYGLRKARFSIVDESYSRGGTTAVIKRIVCAIKVYDSSGTLLSEVLGCLVVGLGDDYVAVTSADTSLWGKLMTEDTMSSCSVELYE